MMEVELDVFIDADSAVFSEFFGVVVGAAGVLVADEGAFGRAGICADNGAVLHIRLDELEKAMESGGKGNFFFRLSKPFSSNAIFESWDPKAGGGWNGL